MGESLQFRLACESDLPAIVAMLADDPFGAQREEPTATVSEKYQVAFKAIIADQNQELTIVEKDGERVATFHLSFIQYLTHQGGLRAQVEAVRTSAQYRGQGIGAQLFAYIIERARARGCCLVQLTSDKRRSDAIRFYESLGFAATHEGMKLKL